MAKSPEELAHVEWLGYVQPVGLVVSIPAMLEAQCYVNKNIMGEHARFLRCLPRDASDAIVPEIRDLAELTQTVFGWEPTDLVEVPQKGALDGGMESLEVILPQYHETLRPTHVVPVFKPAEGQSPWMMLVQDLAVGLDFDQPDATDSARHWNAAPQAKFERLLRETGVPIGLMSNRRSLRLVFAPRGESSGHATFNVDEMAQVAGRPMFAALHMLFSAERMFSLGDNQRLPAILENSRKYQNTVSTKLAEQVLAALYELIRGFQSANDVRGGDLLRQILAANPNHVYSGLLTVLMRLVFVMYAEDRDLMSSDPIYANHYSVTGLFDRLRNDFGRHPDTMDQRYGAWSQLVTLFRLVYEGGQHGDFKLPARKGYLFDPERYPFLEGRTSGEPNFDDQRSTILPRVSDAVVYNALRNLLILDGERLSYRTLDVEQIGSVYETVMGFNLEVAGGRSIAIKPVKTHGAPATINLDALLATPGKDRDKWLKEHADQTVGTAAAKQLKDAGDLNQLLEALDKKVSKKVTPRIVPAGAMVLQPSDERRRSGSHYTPRSLTEPIVRTTLEPILKQLCDPETELPDIYQPTQEDKRRYTTGELAARVRQSEKSIEIAKEARRVGTPHPSQILSLKVCDPAMGSGAFLVETCRQLGDELIKAWYAHDAVPTDIPPDEDELLYARRMIAQRCLYGVDKNIMAVDLAKLSLWLVTLAKDHAFTFLDHALRYGDSLVGLTREQIIGFHWEPKKQKQFGEDLIQKRLDKATEARAKILNAREDVAYRDQEQRMAIANEALNLIRLVGDACVSCFFAADKKKARENELERVFGLASSYLSSLITNQESLATTIDFQSRGALQSAADRLMTCSPPVPAFHWEIEFPEVFSRENGGFDAFVGNPPFLGGTVISNAQGDNYLDWLKEYYSKSGNRMDLVAYFFRKAFTLLRSGGTFGLIATNTIRDGHTRAGGLAVIRTAGGCIYNATRRYVWPTEVAVIVSIIHVVKDRTFAPVILDGKEREQITSYLFHSGGDSDPEKLRANNCITSEGVKPYGQGFIFDDDDPKSTSLKIMRALLEKDPRNSERILPYIGGSEVNESPTQTFDRYIITFGEMGEKEAQDWPDLYAIVDEKVRPERLTKSKDVAEWPWWRFWRTRKTFLDSISGLSHVLVTSTKAFVHFAVSVQPTNRVFAESLVVFALDGFSSLAVIQSRIHELWARFFSSSAIGLSRYNASHCFQTFPMPERWRESAELERIGVSYNDARTQLMTSSQLGLTKTYHRFNSPDERDPAVLELRRLHGEMDQAVLRAYGWHDLADQAAEPGFCQFLLDYEEDDDSAASDSGSARQKKKPWRYRWPDDFRDEVLARLLELNEQRHQEEMLAVGAPLAKPKKQTANKNGDAKKASRNSLGEDTPLFDSSNQSGGR